MASGWYTKGLRECIDGTIDLDTDTLKLMLVNASYAFDADHEVVDNAADDATDPSFNEITATNYTAGWGGAGRKTPTITMQENDTQNRVEAALDDQTWSSIGGATNDTIHGALLVKEGGSDDTTSRLIAFFDITDKTTNGTDFLLNFATLAAGGNMQIAV